ncbi:hypothetical protein GCM10010329_03630 [Streptomyces spiroverticillatus]|uniref:Alpha/beta hydrolase n=1 Tax=Streptomyces finlayi TaxID=67296 RepID=A0A918WSE5_9ACTN|nr:alpha/beta hydrolase [Streptomyces finlayi]GGZ87001.1 hypothetical protein GCM10010329_03630 [Streptomyces spiroverticillatus]GHC78402.1 hypothetical protein GCM10010334_03610 [Streptomyces finlayi]
MNDAYETGIIDLNDFGWAVEDTPHGPRPVPHPALPDFFAERLTPPPGATDLFVYVHGWQTSPESALRSALDLLGLLRKQYEEQRDLYGHLDPFEPWVLLVRWPSASSPGLRGYRRIRDRAHRMSDAPRILGQLLGYVDAGRGDPRAAVLGTREGQFLHLVGHSFGCRFLCEAVQWAADETTLGWSARPRDPKRPFGVDSMLLLQMAAPRDVFETTFTALEHAPVHGPVVATYAQRDWATGVWHRIAEKRAGVGNQGIGPAPRPVRNIALRGAAEPYDMDMLDHWFVSVDASAVFTAGRGPAGAHSDHLGPESAHLLLTLADYSR